MTVPVFLPRTGVTFVVVAIFNRPVSTHRLGRALLLAYGEAAEEVADVAFLGLKLIPLLLPVALDGDG